MGEDLEPLDVDWPGRFHGAREGWAWDDERVRSLLVGIARLFPVGAVMLREAGGQARFQVRPVESAA